MDGGGQMDVGGAEALEDGAAAAQRPAPMAVDGGDEVDGGRSAAAGAPAANEAAAGAVRPVDNCGPLTGPDGEMLYCICREPHNPDDPRFMMSVAFPPTSTHTRTHTHTRSLLSVAPSSNPPPPPRLLQSLTHTAVAAMAA